MPKVNLASSYGYLDPVTGRRIYYGPGQGIEVPQGLVNTLGLAVIPEEASSVAASEPEIIAEDLPADFPGRKYLVAAGCVTLKQTRQLSIDDLVGIKGIGTRLAEQILREVGNG